MSVLLWFIKVVFLTTGLLVLCYLMGFVLVSIVVLVWRHYHICRHDEFSADLEWHQYALLWPLFAAHIIILAPKDIRRRVVYWHHKCQDFWAGLTSS